MNRRNIRNRRQDERKLNEIIRHLCCWNCFQTGHKRFQCPFPKVNRCSFCRRPQVMSINCGCSASRDHLVIPEHQNAVIHNYNQNVVIPIAEGNEVAYQEMDNLVVVGENEAVTEDLDYIELHAESESLDDL